MKGHHATFPAMAESAAAPLVVLASARESETPRQAVGGPSLFDMPLPWVLESPMAAGFSWYAGV